MSSDVQNIRSIYFVGIKGVAMAAMAIFARERGWNVSGSDVTEEFPSDSVLRAAGIQVRSGFDPAHIHEFLPDLVVYTGAHGGKDNAEVIAAKDKGIPCLPHGQALGMVMDGHCQVSIAGSHGKTTTTSMIATILVSAGRDPSYAIGCGEVCGLGLPGHYGTGEVFIAEADEYLTDPGHDATPRFLWQRPDILVVTNIDFDHPDAFRNLREVQSAFRLFQGKQKGKRITVVNGDDPNSRLLLGRSGCRVITFGQSEGLDYRCEAVRADGEYTEWEIHDPDGVHKIRLRVPGVHNVINATAAAAACRELAVPWEDIVKGLAAFCGSKRRFEKIAESDGILFFDDYAHHPREISATLSAARLRFPTRRVIAVFQPHTYSRTKALLPEFAQAFAQSDAVFITEIYGSARETETLGVSGNLLAREVAKFHERCVFVPDRRSLIRSLGDLITDGDVVLFMGAGDIFVWSREVVRSVRVR